jgi:O-antigen/teichoic acid export membrane protein
VSSGPASATLDWRKARSDLSLSFSAQLMYKLIGYVILAVLARYLTPDEFGQFFYAAAVAGIPDAAQPDRP